MSTTTIPTALAHDIAARLCQEADTAARELRTRLIDCMADATSPGLALVRPTADPERVDWREQLQPRVEPAANAPAPEHEPRPISLAVFVDQAYRVALDVHAVPRMGETMHIEGARVVVVRPLEWVAPDIANVHTLTMPPDGGGGPF